MSEQRFSTTARPIARPTAMTTTVPRPTYRIAPVTVVSSPVVDAAVIEGKSRGYVDGLRAAQDYADALEAERRAEHERVLAQHRQATTAAVAALEQAAARLSGTMARTLDDAEDEVFELACQVASLILDAELSDASVAARSAIHRALTTPTPSPVHTVRLHPDVVCAAQELQLAPAAVALVADPSLPAGGAVAEYRDGWLEAGLEDALARVQDHAARAVDPVDGAGEVAR